MVSDVEQVGKESFMVNGLGDGELGVGFKLGHQRGRNRTRVKVMNANYMEGIEMGFNFIEASSDGPAKIDVCSRPKSAGLGVHGPKPDGANTIQWQHYCVFSSLKDPFVRKKCSRCLRGPAEVKYDGKDVESVRASDASKR